MQRDLVLIAVVFLMVIAFPSFAECKVCSSLDIRNNHTRLEALRNCTVIDGYLKILLLDNVQSEHDYDNYTFPELREITEYLFFFKVHKLSSIGTLFPNLRVIRGSKFYSTFSYSLVIFRMDDLQEIGLSNLLQIDRGNVKVDNCYNLCYVDTIDWQRLGVSQVDYKRQYLPQCYPCAPYCHGHCWNATTCQIMDSKDCHPECLGCFEPNSNRDCEACKHYNDDGACVPSCPEHKVFNNDTMKCVTPKECISNPHGLWWVFERSCVSTCPVRYEQADSQTGGCQFCGDNCIRHCPGALVKTKADLWRLSACTHINGSLEIRLQGPITESDLKNLGGIVEIKNNLKVARSGSIKSLQFLKSLKKIAGGELENQRYALFVYENENLEKLWDFNENFTLQINGEIAFHDNPQLCFSEIEKLANLTNAVKQTDLEVFRYSNGERSDCNKVRLNFNLSETNAYNVTIKWDLKNQFTNDTIIGYTVYYTDTVFTNVSTFESKDTCEEKKWKSLFVTSNFVQINNLAPYTRYGYYVTVYSSSRRGGQTDVHFFTTRADDPTEPDEFIADAASDSSIILQWEPPAFSNGKLDHYVITYYYQEDYPSTIEQRDYCLNPHLTELDESSITTTTYSPLNVTNSTTECVCPEEEEVQFFSYDAMRHCKQGEPSACLQLRYKHSDLISRYFHTDDKLPKMLPSNYNEFIVKKRESIRKAFKGRANNQTFGEIVIKNPKVKSFEVKNLKHYSLYVFYMAACNENESEHAQCSPVVMTSERTNKNDDADNITNLEVKSEDNDVTVTWEEPKETNSLLVAYRIEYKRIDVEHSKAIQECITRREFVLNGYSYKINDLAPGSYAVRVQTTSLAGLGYFSPPEKFTIQAPDTVSMWLRITLIFLGIGLVGLVTYGTRRYFRRTPERPHDSVQLIPTVNPDYVGPAPYEPDNYEMNRQDIQFGNEIGQGSFGMVYRGTIRSKDMECAVKTTNPGANDLTMRKFLNEGSVMKAFSDGYHVVKLLGIVSIGAPPLVVMELMERGDLKSYLRSCRGPSTNVTSNEMYRMAAEIADGMAFLAAKKFVHRDLAARNCMVAGDRTVKIGDFGMARDIYETDYYRVGEEGMMPVRWMAPESLKDGVFSSDSDMWSYGVVLWEIATLAEQPYQGLANEQVLKFVRRGGTLDRPNECSDFFYEIMSSCWKWRPIDRPTFTSVVMKLEGHVSSSFHAAAFCFSQQGRDHALRVGPRVVTPAAMLPEVEADIFTHYDAATDDVKLFVSDPNRTRPFDSPLNQRYEKNSPSPSNISPGSPSEDNPLSMS